RQARHAREPSCGRESELWLRAMGLIAVCGVVPGVRGGADRMPDPITNPMADPLVELPDVSPTSQLVDIDATPEGAVTVTMCRATKKNAFDAGLISALDEAFKDLQGAEGVRVIFLRGAGGAFSAGADLDWMRQAVDASESANREDAMALAVMLKRL